MSKSQQIIYHLRTADHLLLSMDDVPYGTKSEIRYCLMQIIDQMRQHAAANGERIVEQGQ